MQTEELIKLVEKVHSYQAELQNVEIKAAHHGCPTRLYDTLSSFSNQDDGGIIVFGVNEASGYEIIGVYDAQDLQKKSY
ncbi:MAG: putative DNA binding domain-containing protein [Eubacteriales bacterium]|nr:putative DNA binding domain-containing protein [Oscillospiraceae bacterium]MDD4493651.1 putative DNA binding domain-containing protein [Eubacteriales bacterium]